MKESATLSSLATLVVKMEQAEGVLVVDVEDIFPSEPREKVFASTFVNMLSLIFPVSCYA